MHMQARPWRSGSFSGNWTSSVLMLACRILCVNPETNPMNAYKLFSVENPLNLQIFIKEKCYWNSKFGDLCHLESGEDELTHCDMVTPHDVRHLNDQHWLWEWHGAWQASSHYLNLCRLIFSWTLNQLIRNKLQWTFNQIKKLTLKNVFVVCKIVASMC